MASAIESAWAVIKADYDEYGQEDADDFMDSDLSDEEKAREEYRRWEGSEEEIAEWEKRHGALQTKLGRDYSHLDEKQAAYQRKLDELATSHPPNILQFLSDQYEHRKKGLGMDEEEWLKFGGADRIGELLGDQEAIDRLAEQFGGREENLSEGGGLAPIRRDEPEEEGGPRRTKATPSALEAVSEGPVRAVRLTGREARRHAGDWNIPAKERAKYIVTTRRAGLSGRSGYLGGSKGGKGTAVTGAAAKARVGNKPTEIELATRSRIAQSQIGKKMAQAQRDMDEQKGSWEPIEYPTDEEGNVVPSMELDLPKGRTKIVPADAIKRPAAHGVKRPKARVGIKSDKKPLTEREVESTVRARGGTETDRLAHDLGLSTTSEQRERKRIAQQQWLNNPANFPERNIVEGLMPWPVDFNIPQSFTEDVKDEEGKKVGVKRTPLHRHGTRTALVRHPDDMDRYVERVRALLSPKDKPYKPQRKVMSEEEIAEWRDYMRRIGWLDD